MFSYLKNVENFMVLSFSLVSSVVVVVDSIDFWLFLNFFYDLFIAQFQSLCLALRNVAFKYLYIDLKC